MQRIDVNKYFGLGMNFLAGETEDGKVHEVNLAKAEVVFNNCLNHNIGNPRILHALGSLNLRRGHYGFAIQILSQATAMDPTLSEAWNNLGLAWMAAQQYDKAEIATKQSIKHAGAEALPDIYANLSALNVNRGRPEKALDYAAKALEHDPNHAKAKWHRGLGNLELRKWGIAWEDHELRLEGGAPGEIARRNYHGPDEKTPTWDGKSPGLIVIHGEQGMGDEIMFASCISDALKVEGARFVFEPSPRLEKLFARSFPSMKVYGTDDTDGKRWVPELGRPDYKIAIGSLPLLYRRSEDAFPGSAYLVADRSKRQWWGEKLNALGRRPNIGISWQGGVEKTHYHARSFHPTAFKQLFAEIDANWISLQYDSTAQHCVNEVRDQLGVKLMHWPKAVEQKDPDTGKISDLDELVALISKLDLVISVCNTNVHVAGALGVPTLCLTPSEPSWRYGAVESDEMPWYGSVRLLRQAKGTTDWGPVIEDAVSNAQAFLKVMNQAETMQ